MTDAFPSLSTFGLDHSYSGEETEHSCPVSRVTAQYSFFSRDRGEVWYEAGTGSVKHRNSSVGILIQREFPENNAVL